MADKAEDLAHPGRSPLLQAAEHSSYNLAAGLTIRIRE
jgi:hypothetical protein